MDAWLVVVLDGFHRQGQRLLGDEVELLGQGIDAHRQEVQQAIVTEGGQLVLASRSGCFTSSSSTPSSNT